MAVLAAVLAGLITWTVLSGVIRLVSVLPFASLGHNHWISGDTPIVLDAIGFVTLLLILAAAIQVGRATGREKPFGF
jgi:hypothetical protein